MHRPSVRVLIHVEPLPESAYPAQAFRRPNLTLVWVHPGVSMAEAAWWGHHNLTDDERGMLRLQLGMNPNLSVPPDDSRLDGTIDEAMLTFPASVLMPDRGTHLTPAG